MVAYIHRIYAVTATPINQRFGHFAIELHWNFTKLYNLVADISIQKQPSDVMLMLSKWCFNVYFSLVVPLSLNLGSSLFQSELIVSRPSYIKWEEFGGWTLIQEWNGGLHY